MSGSPAVQILFRRTALSAAVLVAFVVLVTGCASLPPPKDRLETAALTDTAGTRLGRAIAPGITANPGKTGIHRLPDPRDAFAARVLLAGAAEKSLDVQYFIWHGDHVGYLLFQALWQAAERGVRVRLLLDDLNTKGLDPTIADARRASEHRGAPLQPARQPRQPRAQLPD